MRTNDEIINIIDAARENKKMSVSELARQTGMAKSAVSRYLNKTREFPLNRANDFAKALGMTPEFLLGVGVKEQPAKPSHQSTYNYFDAGLSAGVLMSVDPFTSSDVEKISISDIIMGKYAGDKDIFISFLNGESMNRIIPDGSLIAIKKYDDVSELCNGDIVVFQDQGEMAVKRFYNDRRNGIITFNPDSTDDKFTPINYLYANLDNVRIIGKVVVYTVTV